MPIHAPSDTLLALGGGLLNRCESRSLFQSRFADPQAKEDSRKDWFNALLKRRAQGSSSSDWFPTQSEQLHARLMSRLMVDMSDGVMENANVLLDRYGLPYIPGSAVKGCARRMALQALHDWIAAGSERPAADDACGPCCEGFTSPAEMLAAIARVFGWVETDWSNEKNRDPKTKQETTWKSDFAWVCSAATEQNASAGNATPLVGSQPQSNAPTGQNIPAQGNALDYTSPTNPIPEGAAQNVRTIFAQARALLPDHKTFAGTIAFLEAKPNTDPGLELDVITPHHTKYYQGELEKATDTEDPVPVYFPAVKAQRETDYFTFPLIPLRRAVEGDVAIAKRWLANGLELFGLGGKTAAGYGWFDASETLQEAIKSRRQSELKKAKEKAANKAEEEKKALKAKQHQQEKEALAKALEGLSPEEQEDWKIAQLSAQQFDNKLRNFFKDTKKGGPTELEKPALIRALKGSHLELWKQFKAKATKGDLARAATDIHALNKKLHGDKMP